MNDNVVELAQFQRPHETEADQAPAAEAARPRPLLANAGHVARSVGLGLGFAAFGTLRVLAFLVLRVLRFPVCLCLTILSGAGVLGTLMIWAGFHGPEKATFLTVTIVMALASAGLRYLYDWLLVSLAPSQTAPI
jgi:hypothetical protein